MTPKVDTRRYHGGEVGDKQYQTESKHTVPTVNIPTINIPTVKTQNDNMRETQKTDKKRDTLGKPFAQARWRISIRYSEHSIQYLIVSIHQLAQKPGRTSPEAQTYSVLSIRKSVLRKQQSVLSTQYSVLSTQYSLLNTH